MNKISFIIPNNNKKESLKSLEVIDISEQLTTEQLTTTKEKNKIINITNYTKIAPNVYSFNSNKLDLINDIYILYNDACQVKHENKIKAIQMFKKCVELINDKIKKEIIYEIFINLALLESETNGSSDIVADYYEKALSIFSDRAEPYFYWSIFCNKIQNFEKSHILLNKALLLSYDEAKLKYPGTQFTAYGKYLYDELAVSCYWLKKYDEAKKLLEQIIDDPDFANNKERIRQNLENINIAKK